MCIIRHRKVVDGTSLMTVKKRYVFYMLTLGIPCCPMLSLNSGRTVRSLNARSCYEALIVQIFGPAQVGPTASSTGTEKTAVQLKDVTPDGAQFHPHPPWSQRKLQVSPAQVRWAHS